MSRGQLRLTLFETVLVISIAGTVLAVFVPTFAARLRTDKIAEPTELLQSMHDGATAYYATRWDNGLERCLPAAAGPAPEQALVEPVAVDFAADDAVGAESWQALGFQPDRPIRYRYQYAPAKSGCGLGAGGPSEEVLFVAEGDLDGDGVLSRFERRARPGPDGVLHPVEELFVHQRVE